jgi:hypothetical protein
MITAALDITTILRRGAITLFKSRAKIVGFLLLASIINLSVVGINELLGYADPTKTAHEWLVTRYHWAFILGGVSLVVALAWNYVSPTIRTIFGSWVRVGLWGFIGLALLATSLIGWPHTENSYRNGYVGAAILYLVTLAVVAKSRPPRKPKYAPSLYADDNPKLYNESPPFQTQERAFSEIRYLISGGKPSAFVIAGPWGIGKTFLLEHAKAELTNDKLICVEFEPWRYASEEALIRGFFQDISTALSDNILGVQHIVGPLTQAAEGFIREHDGSGLISTMSDAVRSIRSTSTPEQQIGNLLKNEGKRLVVVIDNVERSYDPERIFRTLQLVHFAQGISDVQVVLLCELETIFRARPKHFGDNSKDASEYLEKFAGKIVTVPSPRPAELRGYLTDLLNKHSATFDVDENTLPNEMLDTIKTPRGMIRIFNEVIGFRANVEEDQR